MVSLWEVAGVSNIVGGSRCWHYCVRGQVLTCEEGLLV